MTQDVHKVVELRIHAGKLAEFKQIAKEFIDRVESTEPGALSYEWFIDDDQNICYILEWYRDSESLLTHLENIRDLYEPMFAVSKITRLKVFGSPSEKVRQAHLPGTKFYDHWAGFTRQA